MMKRLVTFLFFATLLLLAGAMIAPGFIDWNNHKDRITAELARYVQRKVEIAGNVKFKILPQPQVTLEDVTIGNAEGAKAPFFLHLKQLEARIKLMSLLNGKIEVENVNLDGPELNLEILDGGRANWTGILKETGAKPQQTVGFTLEDVRLNRVTVGSGSIHYFNHVTGSEGQVDRLGLAIAAETLLGPYRVGGSFDWRGAPVNFDISTGRYDAAIPMPVKISLLPAAGMPQVKVNGVLDLSAGFDLQGDLEMEQGAVAGLLDDAFLKSVPFLNDPVTLTSALEFKGDTFRLNDIKAKFGEKGAVTGAVAVQFARDKKPVAGLKLEGSNLNVSLKPGASAVPDGFILTLNLKGKDITWNGMKIPAVTFSADADGDWAVKQAQVTLPGKTSVGIAGVITPKAQSSALAVQVRTEDAGKFFQALNLPDNNVLKTLAAAPPMSKMDFSASVDVKQDKISLSDISAVLDGKVKVKGALDVGRTGGRPVFAAKLSIDGWDYPASGLTDELMKADGALDLSFTDFRKGDFRIAAMKISARTDAQGLTLKEVSATLSQNEGFDLSGHVSSLTPLAGFDVEYGAKLSDGSGFAKAFGLPLPPPLRDWKNISLHGKIAGDPAKYTFTAEGKIGDGDMNLGGGAEAGVVHAALRLKTSAGAAIGLPLERLLARGGTFDFSGDVSGTAESFRIENIKSQLGSNPLSGVIERKDGKYSADLAVDKIDFDDWLWNDWSIKEGMTLSLRGKTLEWRGLTVEDAALQMIADGDTIKTPKVTGKLWGGDVDIAVESVKKDGVWSGALKGGVANADLDELRKALEIPGITLGRGGLELDLKSDGAKFFDMFQGVSGTVGVRAQTLTVAEFTPAEIPPVLSQLKAAPENLQQLINHALKEKGGGTYANVDIPLKIEDGKVTFSDVKLSGENHEVTVGASIDLSPDTYDLSAIVHLKQPAGVPDMLIHRVDDLKKQGDYGVDARAVERWLAKKYPPQEAIPPPVSAPPPDTVKGIMERLE